ncbi:calcium channel flower isoform X1 [Diprion similis]|uniref:calcium channel flower isoform X1 n=1 Tax=Diprion similis TaxID=362088 RepID=UPI001EF99529|nr:calcium channel flower isoform X1 [Diprion similis]
MSFGDKIASIMERPGQDPVTKDEVPWWMKYAGRGVGTIGGFFAILLGAWGCVGIITGSVSALIAGMWQMVAGFLVIIIEAPCCCLFIDFVQNLSDWVDRKPYWQRAAVYCLIALPAVILDAGLGTIFGSGLIFATGIIYGLMSLGKKASVDDMRMAAAVETQVTPGSNMRSTLVENAHPIGFSIAPDSNV